MRLYKLQLILENRPYIDHTAYGSWVDAVNGKVYPVGMAAHAKFIQDNMNLFTKDNLTIDSFGGEPYALAFYNGFVRMVHENGDEYLDVQGMPQDIKKIKQLIIDVAEVEGKKEINIDVVKPFSPTKQGTNQPPPSKDYYFNFDDIKSKRELNQFLRAA